MAPFDYTAVGHVTVDVLADGARRPGGGAFYSAVQAARLGMRTLIVTQGVPSEIEAMLRPHRGELELLIHAAPQTTTLHTESRDGARRQRLLAWAGAITAPLEVDTDVLHLAPVAQETPSLWSGTAAFVGLTPQGLLRSWRAPGATLSLRPLAAERLPRRLDAAVFSETEHTCCAPLLELEGVVIAITAGAGTTLVRAPRSGFEPVAVSAVAQPVEDLGAGDVFAAAFFCRLRGGDDPVAAAAFANAAAAMRIAGAGAQTIAEGREIARRARSAELGGGRLK